MRVNVALSPCFDNFGRLFAPCLILAHFFASILLVELVQRIVLADSRVKPRLNLSSMLGLPTFRLRATVRYALILAGLLCILLAFELFGVNFGRFGKLWNFQTEKLAKCAAFRDQSLRTLYVFTIEVEIPLRIAGRDLDLMRPEMWNLSGIENRLL